MAALRTQIYLTVEQRRRLDAISRADGKPLAELIREAVDDYLGEAAPDADVALSATFGAAPAFDVPQRAEWSGRDPLASDG